MKTLKYLLTIFKYNEKDQLTLKPLNVKLNKSHVKYVSKVKTLPSITVHTTHYTCGCHTPKRLYLSLPYLWPSRIVNYEFFFFFTNIFQ